MRLAAIASALAIVLCVAAFGAILLQKASIPVPAPAPPHATPTEGRSPGSVATVADSAAESAATAPAAVDQASPTPAAQALPMPSAMPTSCSNPNAIGISRVVEIDTTGGPGFGFEHFKAHDFLREGEVVLTFDDGPWPKNTPAVLAALAAHCTKAIFFPIGLHATYEPGILKQVAAAGHAIGSHTWCHQDLSKTKGKCNVNGKVQTVEYNPIDEIEMGISAVHWAVGGPTAPYFRFPALRQPPELIEYLGKRSEHCRGVLRPGAVVEGEHDLAFAQKIMALEVLESEAGAAGGVDLDNSRHAQSVWISGASVSLRPHKTPTQRQNEARAKYKNCRGHPSVHESLQAP